VTSKEKKLGLAAENRTVRLAKAEGLNAKRQPLSGVLPDYPSDVIIEHDLLEVKVRTERLNAKGERIVPL